MSQEGTAGRATHRGWIPCWLCLHPWARPCTWLTNNKGPGCPVWPSLTAPCLPTPASHAPCQVEHVCVVCCEHGVCILDLFLSLFPSTPTGQQPHHLSLVGPPDLLWLYGLEDLEVRVCLQPCLWVKTLQFDGGGREAAMYWASLQ